MSYLVKFFDQYNNCWYNEYMTKAHELSKSFGMLYLEEVDALIDFAKSLPENAVCINIGAGTGTSALAILEQRPDLMETFTTVDISRGSPLGGLRNERNAFDNAGIALRHKQVLSDSVQAGQEFVGDIDFIFVDGNHTYEGVKGDIQAWIPKVKNGGIAAFHDYQPAYPMVKRAIDEFMSEHEEISYVRSMKVFRIKRLSERQE